MSPVLPGATKVVVLVVEDDPDLRLLYREALAVLGGYVVVAVEDGMDALRYLDAEAAPSAVLLDLNLPRVSGRDVQHELAAHDATRKVPVIIVTGTPAGIDPDDVACVLRKPVDVESLVRAVQDCVRKAMSREP